MKIVIVGSTGRTGMEVVTQALARGHQVCAWARTPEKMPLEHPNLEVLAIDILSSELEAALTGAQAVIVSLGGAHLKDTATRSEGTKRLIEAMQRADVDRLVVVSTAGVGSSFDQLSPRGQEVVRTVIKEAVEDHGRQEALVTSSGLRWTIGRPGGLGTGPLSSYVADPNGEIQIGGIDRACVADFALNAIENDATVGKIFGLSGS